MDIAELRERAIAHMQKLHVRKRKLAPRDFAWYPYDTLASFVHLERLLTGEWRHLFDSIGDGPIVDIGCADGDTAFFLESLGFRMEVVDNVPTNYNKMKGVRLLKDALASAVEIHEADLDQQFVLPRADYSLALFLGILYHLKNPYYVLESLAKSSRYCLLSTRVARLTPDKRVDNSRYPMAYLLDAYETNNDATNYWIFSDAGLRRILARTGWDVCDYVSVGNTTDSDPVSPEGDERVFCLAKSRYFS